METDEQVIRRLRGKVAEQAEEILQLRAMLTTTDPLPVGLPPLSPKEEEILRMMLGRDWVRQSAIKATAIPSHVDDADNYLKVYICKIRNKVRSIGLGIENHKGVAYRLIPLDAAARHAA